MRKNVSIVIPFLNEAENIPFLVKGLKDFFSDGKPYNGEIIFVDDGSTDTSVELLKKAAHGNYSARIVSLSKNYGSHAALRAGILHASGDYTGFIYADLQDPLYLIDRLFGICESGSDIAWATRESTENGFFERTFSKTYSFLMQKYAMNNYPKQGFDIVMFNQKVQKGLNENIESNSSAFLQLLTMGFKQSTIFYKKESRKKGKSKWTIRKKIKLLIDSFIAFSYMPIRFVTFVGILLFIIGALWTAYIIARKLIYDDLESGWPALVSILTLGFGVTNISLGIMAEYLWRTLDSSRKRPVFIIDHIIEVGGNEKI
jgi:polyisoprenyl-phosphate glycosyltransferase